MSDTVVVMDAGRIQQIGTPQDIYNEPQNAFVADFIGESNILDGIMHEDYLVEFFGRKFQCLDTGFEKDEPVDVVIRLFAEFVGDSVLVGHNIKSSDLHYITAAANRAGVAFENKFFDTYLYAKTFKEQQGWENVKLEYLSKVFGITQNEAHRAWCDAEANVGVYFKLKEL